MILTIDVGNTNIALGAVLNARVAFVSRLATDRSRTADEYAVLLRLVSEQYGFDISAAQGAIICSVAPRLTPVIKEAVRMATGVSALIVGPGVKTGLNIRIDDPSELGGDFVAAAVAAAESYRLPCVTIDMGTATSLGVLDKSGSHIGVIICPGVAVSQEALVTGASRLPRVGIEPPSNIIGRNTEASMKSGLIYGTAAMLDGLIARIEEELGERVSVVVSGDPAAKIIPYCKRTDIVIDNELIMRGLFSIFNKNRNMIT